MGKGNFIIENNGVTVNNTSETGEYYIRLREDLNVKPNTIHTLIIDIETASDFSCF